MHNMFCVKNMWIKNKQMSSLSPLPLDGAGVSVKVTGGRRHKKLGAGDEKVEVQVAPAGMGMEGARRRRSRRAGQEAAMEGARRRRSRRAGQEAAMEGARRRRRSRRAGQDAAMEGARRRHRSRKH